MYASIPIAINTTPSSSLHASMSRPRLDSVAFKFVLLHLVSWYSSKRLVLCTTARLPLTTHRFPYQQTFIFILSSLSELRNVTNIYYLNSCECTHPNLSCPFYPRTLSKGQMIFVIGEWIYTLFLAAAYRELLCYPNILRTDKLG